MFAPYRAWAGHGTDRIEIEMFGDYIARAGELIRTGVAPGLAEQWRAAAAKAGVSPYQWFLAAWVALLGRYISRDDIHIGTMFSTRAGAQQQPQPTLWPHSSQPVLWPLP